MRKDIDIIPSAHSKKDCPRAEWQSLAEHCAGVSRTAMMFAEGFGSGAWAALLGVLHDIGKARASFQNYLARANGLTDVEYDVSDHSHSGAGAVWAVRKFGRLGRILAYCVAGHHAGLADWQNGPEPNGALAQRLADEAAVIEEPQIARWIAAHEAEWRQGRLVPPWRFSGDEVALWIRMLYSCLVDADFLDTEAFMDPGQSSARAGYPGLPELAKSFFTALDAKQTSAPPTPVNAIRAEIRAACEQAAGLPSGLFSLTVPTGGGKTLSSTAFAFRHALLNGLKRIIYVIPYTSIIEQTADTLRAFLGADNVVEHHSNFDPEKETQASSLASENWDAPVIVTTSVQFFESLYSNRSGRCRKLHNIAESVVILDEVQLLPMPLLKPCLAAIRDLAAHYRTTFVLSSATQPVFEELQNVREMIPPEMNLHGRLRRTRLELPVDLRSRRSWEEIAEELKTFPQVLCVVNTRRDCRDLFALMPEETVHLSASMCGEHRSRMIAEIKRRLAAREPVRVVSTQLVEAGVDIDFPVVYRAFAGLDSIVQSAGRCNREGLSETPGRVVVFMPPKPAPVGALRKAEDALSGLLAAGMASDDTASYPRFFKAYRASQNDLGEKFDDWLVKGARDFQFQFREAAAAFRMIDDKASVPVIVRYGEGDSLIEKLRAAGPTRDVMRRLQRFTVNVPRGALPSLLEKGFVEELSFGGVGSGIFVQTMPDLYSDKFGFDLWRENLPVEDLMI